MLNLAHLPNMIQDPGSSGRMNSQAIISVLDKQTIVMQLAIYDVFLHAF